MDERTAMLKMAPTSAQLPAQGKFVPLNIDDNNLPSDWYRNQIAHQNLRRGQAKK